MAEKLRVDGTFRDSAAVDRDILPMLAAAVLMDNLGEMLLAHAALAGDEHREVGGSHLDGNVYRAVQPFGISDNAELEFHLLNVCCDHVFHLIWQTKIRIMAESDRNFGSF